MLRARVPRTRVHVMMMHSVYRMPRRTYKHNYYYDVMSYSKRMHARTVFATLPLLCCIVCRQCDARSGLLQGCVLKVILYRL